MKWLAVLLLTALAFGQGAPSGSNYPSGSGATSSAAVVAFFTGCSGTLYLGADGACHASGLPTHLTYVDPTLTVSAATFGNGAIALSGNTSGVATITAPAVAGTVTQPFTFSNPIIVPVSVAAATTGIGFGSGGVNGTGISATSAGNVLWVTDNTAPYFGFTRNVLRGISGNVYGWAASSTDASIAGSDTGISRTAADAIAFGNGTAADASAALSAASLALSGSVGTYQNLATAGSGLSPVQAAPAVIAIGTGASISATSLCSTTLCPAGDYLVHAYIDITTGCTTTGSYIVWVGFTDDGGAKTGSSTTTFIPFPLNGSGVTATVGTLVPLATTNYANGTFFLRTTGAATGGLGSINYGTTATACGTGGPMVGKLYLDVSRLR
jgi:hypothetical protein